MGFKETKPELLTDNPFKLIGSDWMLITAGNLPAPGFNTMTASWADWAFCGSERWRPLYRRRATPFPILKRHTCSRCRSSMRSTAAPDLLRHPFGTGHGQGPGGRLTPVQEAGFVYFSEARLVLACRKIYHQTSTPDASRSEDRGMYPQKDYHRMYIARS